MDINKEFEKLAEEFEKEWHDGHEPQGIDDQYVEEMEDEEVQETKKHKREDSGKDFDFSKDPPDPDLGSEEEEEDEARTYLNRKDDDEKKDKKRGVTPMSQKKKRWGSGGYGKGEEVEEDYDKNQLLRVQHDEKLIAETGDICSLDRGDLRSKSMQKVYDKKCSPEMIKKKKSIFGKIAKNLELYNSVGEQKMEEAVNLKQLKKQYDKNEDENRHTENYLLLAKAFGSKSEVKKVQDIMKRNEKQGHTSKSDMDWMYKNINPYYDKIRNEETMKTEKLVDTVRKVLMGEGEGDQAEYQKKRKEVAKKFGVESCSALKDEAKRKECYNALDKAHVADHEEQVELAKMKKEGVGELSDKELKSKMKDASTQKETDAACGEMGKRRLKMEKKKVTESAALQLKMAFDDAKIKIKGVKGGKLVIDKKDKKKAEDVISKQMKKPADAKRVLGSQIVFEASKIPEPKVEKGRGGWQVMVWSPKGKYIPMGQPHKDKKSAEKEADSIDAYGHSKEEVKAEKTMSKLFSHVRKLMSK